MKKVRNQFYIDVGCRFRQIRNLKQLSLEYVADHLGISWKTLQRYETGEIHIPTEAIAKCARVFQTPVGFFYGEDAHLPANSNITRISLMAAGEIMGLPNDDVRKSIIHLVRTIKRIDHQKDTHTD